MPCSCSATDLKYALKSLLLHARCSGVGIQLKSHETHQNMGKSCCAIDCKNRFNKNSELSFYRLPKAKEKRSKWITALRRNNWNPGSETWICSSHFISGKKSDNPLHPDYVPSLFSFTSATDRTRAVNNLERFSRLQEDFEKKHTSGETTATSFLIPNQIKEEVGVAHQIKEEVQVAYGVEESGTVHQVKGESGTMHRVEEESGTMRQVKEESGTVHQVKGEVEMAHLIIDEADTTHEIKEEVETVHQIITGVQTVPTLLQDTEVQTVERHHEIASLHEQVKSLNTECQSLRDKIHKLESELKRRTLDTAQFDDSKMKIFTGLPNLNTFMLLFSYMSSILPDTEKQSLKPTQELLLTLMKLRHNLTENFLGQLFGIHQSTVSRIFRRWIQVMASRLPEAEFPLLKAAVSQHVSPPGSAEGAHSGGKVTPASILYKT